MEKIEIYLKTEIIEKLSKENIKRSEYINKAIEYAIKRDEWMKRARSAKTIKKAIASKKNGKKGGRIRNNDRIKNLTKGLLWNFDVERMDYKRDKKKIIERIIDAGLEEDEILMWKIYKFEDIKNIAINMENMRKDTLTYISFVLKTKEGEFKCYKKKEWYRS